MEDEHVGISGGGLQKKKMGILFDNPQYPRVPLSSVLTNRYSKRSGLCVETLDFHFSTLQSIPL